jgi:hypothetical protein
MIQETWGNPIQGEIHVVKWSKSKTSVFGKYLTTQTFFL